MFMTFHASAQRRLSLVAAFTLLLAAGALLLVLS